jgi:hypothetical protein
MEAFAPPPPSSYAPAANQPYTPAFAPPFTLQAPETIDFAADAQPLVMRRSGPPGLVVLIILLGAMVGGAKLAQVVTGKDVAALEAPAAALDQAK